MKANEVPEKIYLTKLMLFAAPTINSSNNDIEYIRKDSFIEKACQWIKSNITNNPNANSVLVRNGCVTLDMLVDDFKNYMEGE